jgi:hypothetical protein
MIRAILLIALVIGAYAYASNNDYKAAQVEHEHACEMIHAGAWPLSVDPSCEVKK